MQAEVTTKIKDTEMSTGRKAVFTLAIGVTDMRHFNTQFSEGMIIIIVNNYCISHHLYIFSLFTKIAF